MKRLITVLVLSIVVLGVVPFGSVSALTLSGFDPVMDCNGITIPDSYTFTYDRNNTGTGNEAVHITVVDGNGRELYSEAGAFPVGSFFSAPPGVSVPYAQAPTMNPIIMRVYSDAGNGLPEVVVFEKWGECEGLPYANIAGCDLNVAIPPQAVNGRFLSNALVYGAPGEPTSPPVVIETGKTYLVAGLDASGMYYKVLLSCEWIWVEAGTVGPDYDPPWNGAPLPTTVVE
jgi:hypothetical protein